MSNNKEYMRQYMLDRYHRRRQAAIKFLGGKCVECGTNEDLEIDHRDAKQKTFHIGRALTSMAQNKLDAELAKCQLLCRKHHEIKSIADMGFSPAGHGSRTTYRKGCRCVACKEAQNKYCKEYKRTRRENAAA